MSILFAWDGDLEFFFCFSNKHYCHIQLIPIIKPCALFLLSSALSCIHKSQILVEAVFINYASSAPRVTAKTRDAGLSTVHFLASSLTLSSTVHLLAPFNPRWIRCSRAVRQDISFSVLFS